MFNLTLEFVKLLCINDSTLRFFFPIYIALNSWLLELSPYNLVSDRLDGFF